MKIYEFDYKLPEHLIALKGKEPRDLSKLLIVIRKLKDFIYKKYAPLNSLYLKEKKVKIVFSKYNIKDISFFKLLKNPSLWEYPGIIIDKFLNLPFYLAREDLIVLNNTKVIPARFKIPEKENWEIFLVSEEEKPYIKNDKVFAKWQIIGKPGKKLKPGKTFVISEDIKIHILSYLEEGKRLALIEIKTSEKNPFFAFINALFKYAQIPLPPYIKRSLTYEDYQRYQTIYAKEYGSVAAPTAGLHFTKRVFKALDLKNIKKAFITLHVGLGTFRPIKVEDIEKHKMDYERYKIYPETYELIKETKKKEKAVVAVGTTVTRCLESAFDENLNIKSFEGKTNLFIYPGYKFKVVDHLITNFHLPRSSLILLVSAFAGTDLTLTAYKIAMENKFKFYSYGDAMLII